jgi:hypothetical protein
MHFLDFSAERVEIKKDSRQCAGWGGRNKWLLGYKSSDFKKY